MPFLQPVTLSPQFEHEMDLWQKEEVFRFYATQRKINCTFLEIQDLWMQAPYCEDCATRRWDYGGELPDSTPDTWEENLAAILGDDDLVSELKRPDDSLGRRSLICHRCHHDIVPSTDDLYVVTYHLEEHFGIDLETPGRTWPGKRLTGQILSIYDGSCFNCSADENLHIDHILARSQGGDAAFRNLQPLCEECGQRKGDQVPEEVGVYSTMYFDGPPSDAYEGMFW